MDYKEFKTEANNLGYNLEENTMIDAYAHYEINRTTIEAACEYAVEEELYY